MILTPQKIPKRPISAPVTIKTQVHPLPTKIPLKFNSKNPRWLKYIREIVVNSASESTTHGLPQIAKRTNWIIRAMWVVCFLTSAIVCTYMISISIMTFFAYETVTKAQRVYVTKTEFPSISICNLNPFTTNKSYEFVRTVLEDSGFIDNSTEILNSLFENTLRTLKLRSVMFVFSNNLTDEQKKSLGYDLKDTLISCTFNIDDCSANDFEWYFDLQYGNCYKFNGRNLANGSVSSPSLISRPGPLNGFSAEFFVPQPESIFALSASTGIRVTIHNKTDIPQLFSGISVATGTQTSIQVDRLFATHLPRPYSDCEKNIDESHPSKLVRSLLKNGYSYSQQTCFLACYQLYAIKECSCFNAYVQHVTGIPNPNDRTLSSSSAYCSNSSLIACEQEKYQTFFMMDVESMCSDECPLECQRVIYNQYTSFAHYPSEIYANSLMANPRIQSFYAQNLSRLTHDSLKRSMLQMFVYYGDLGYEEYNEVETMTWIDLISNIGGTLGLFLGMSFLSFVEVLDVILQIVFYRPIGLLNSN